MSFNQNVNTQDRANKNVPAQNASAQDKATEETPALELVDFSFSWNTAAEKGNTESAEGCSSPSELLFENVNLTLKSGEFALLTGKTGCGKSSLLRCLKPELHLNASIEGVREIFARDISGYTQEESACTIAYVQQNCDSQIVCDTVWHELVFGLENLGKKQDIMQLRVAEIANYFGIEKWLHKRCSELSNGQKQLVNLGSVLIMRPRILLLDEPTSMLDPITEKNFLHMLFRVNKELGITIIIATHSAQNMLPYASCELRIQDRNIKKLPLDFLANTTLAQTILETPNLAASEKLSTKKLDLKELPSEVLSSKKTAHKESAMQGEAFEDLVQQEETFKRTPPKESSPKRMPPKESSSKAAYAIKARDLYFSYSKDAGQILRGCSLKIKQGQIHAIIGANGSGKSTLLKLFAGILRPQLGKITSACKGAQGYLPQNPRELFVCDSVYEELCEWQDLAGYSLEDVQKIAAGFGVADLMDKHPLDISGGQQQLIALAKIMLCKPRLLLLDEISNGLDACAKLQLGKILQRMASGVGASGVNMASDTGAASVRGLAANAGTTFNPSTTSSSTTIVFATHDLNFAKCVAQNVSFLFDGRIINSAPVDEFFDDNMFYAPKLDEFSTLWEQENQR